MKIPLLPTALFLSLALNLFLVGVIAGTWREMRGPPAAATAPVAEGTEAPPPPVLPGNPVPQGREEPDPPVTPPPSSGARQPAPPPPLSEVTAPAPRPVETASRPPERRVLAHEDFRAFPPPPTVGPPRPPAGNPLMIVIRDLPEGEGMALRALLRLESEAVRDDLVRARRERAAAWRALARGEVSEADAARRLDMAYRRELAARSRVESAVAEWALRQSPEVRARVGEALARDALPRGRQPVRPDRPEDRPSPGPEGAAGGS